MKPQHVQSNVTCGLVLTGMYVRVLQKRAKEGPLGVGKPPCGSEMLNLQARGRAQCQESYLQDTSCSSIGTTAHFGLWFVEKCPSIFSYLPPTLSIFSLPALEDLFLLPLSILSWVFPFFSSLPVLE